MSTLLVKNAHCMVTMDNRRREIPGGGLFIRDGVIESLGTTEELPHTADEILDANDSLILPGLINTHHHFYQTLTRNIPTAQNANLFQWLKTLYPIWAGITPEDIFVSTQTALAELALSGCTTSSDHLYLFPNGAKLDDEIAAAAQIGLRLHASRGSMSLGESKGGLPPDEVCDSEDFIIEDSIRLIEQYHDSSKGSMLQIVLAPCSPFSVSGDLMKESAKIAREYHVHLHTHLAETKDEEDFCLQKFGYRPAGYMESLDWTGNDVWFAHSIHVNPEEIRMFAHTGCGVAHCPSSNMRLASGIAPILDMINANIPVGIGVDGSASNDSSHLIAEARQAMLLARLRAGLMGASRSQGHPSAIISARQVLEIATVGGARVLGRTDIGSLELGKCADFIVINLNRLDYAGALHDPVAACLFCSPVRVDHNVVHGKFIVKDGELTTLDLPKQIEKHNKHAKKLLENH